MNGSLEQINSNINHLLIQLQSSHWGPSRPLFRS
jgi:hypothetical protein